MGKLIDGDDGGIAEDWDGKGSDDQHAFGGVGAGAAADQLDQHRRIDGDHRAASSGGG